MQNLFNDFESLLMIFGLISLFFMLFLFGLDVKHIIIVNGKIKEEIINDYEQAQEIFNIYKRYNKNQRDIIKLKSKFIF